MARPASKHPTELELAILKILWDKKSATVRQVRDALAAERDLAYTTVMTMMNIMANKKYLKRTKKSGGYLYRPTISEADTSRKMLADLVRRVFDGSSVAAMVNLLETTNISPEELSHLRQLIESKSKGADQ